MAFDLGDKDPYSPSGACIDPLKRSDLAANARLKRKRKMLKFMMITGYCLFRQLKVIVKITKTDVLL